MSFLSGITGRVKATQQRFLKPVVNPTPKPIASAPPSQVNTGFTGQVPVIGRLPNLGPGIGTRPSNLIPRPGPIQKPLPKPIVVRPPVVTKPNPTPAPIFVPPAPIFAPRPPPNFPIVQNPTLPPVVQKPGPVLTTPIIDLVPIPQSTITNVSPQRKNGFTGRFIEEQTGQEPTTELEPVQPGQPGLTIIPIAIGIALLNFLG